MNPTDFAQAMHMAPAAARKAAYGGAGRAASPMRAGAEFYMPPDQATSYYNMMDAYNPKASFFRPNKPKYTPPPYMRKIKAADWYQDMRDGRVGLGAYRRRRIGTAKRRAKPRAQSGRFVKRRKAPVKRRRYVHGRGAYTTGEGGFLDWLKQKAGQFAASDTGRNLIGSGLRAAGGSLGNMLGSRGMGQGLGAAASRALGFGGYRRGRRLTGRGAIDDIGAGGMDSAIGDMGAADANAIARQVARSQNAALITQGPDIAKFVNTGEGDVVISHREYIVDVVSGGPAFSLVNTFALNPGLDLANGGCTPWLADIARHFQQYRWLGLTFTFISTSGSLATTQALGEVLMSTNFNVTDPKPLSKSDMLYQSFNTAGVPSSDLEHAIECSPRETILGAKLYVRGGPVETGADPHFYDMAETNIATQGQAAAGIVLGSLYVSYQISLSKPQLPSVQRQNVSSVPMAFWTYSGVGAYQYFTISSLLDPFGFSNPAGILVYDSAGFEFGNVNGRGGQPLANKNKQVGIKPGVQGTFVVMVTVQTAAATGNTGVSLSCNFGAGVSQYAGDLTLLGLDSTFARNFPDGGTAARFTTPWTDTIGSTNTPMIAMYVVTVDTKSGAPALLGSYLQFDRSTSDGTIPPQPANSWPHVGSQTNVTINIRKIDPGLLLKITG